MKADCVVIDFESPRRKSASTNELNVYSFNGNIKRRRPYEICSTDAQLKTTNIVIWQKPVITSKYFIKEIHYMLYKHYLKWKQVTSHVLYITALLITSVVISFRFDGPHQYVLKKINLYLYWMFLGILSSVGLGTGLHTFVLYLGPHTAAVTIAANECHSVDFPEPPYPQSIICPAGSNQFTNSVSIWSILYKVCFESFWWGAGTAIGELPPYFLARAARLSSRQTFKDDDFTVFIEKNKSKTIVNRMKQKIELLLKKTGFWGILACASVPNPLFDLAGITCGHFLISFWEFFGATLIGKAVIKVTIQQILVVVIFSDALLDRLMGAIGNIPSVGSNVRGLIENFLHEQRSRLHNKEFNSRAEHGTQNVLALLFQIITSLMIIYFIISVINSLAQAHYNRTKKFNERV